MYKPSSVILYVLLAFQVQSQYDEEGERLLRVNNNIVETTIYSFSHEKADSSLSHKLYYNTNGNLIREDRYNENGQINVSHVYQYDSLGNKIKYDVYDGNKERRGGTQFDVSNNGRIITTKYINGNTVTYGQKWFYNEMKQDTALFNKNLEGEYYLAYHKTYNNGQPEMTTNYDESGRITSKVLFKYDTVNNVNSLLTVKNGEAKLSSVFKQDSNHRIIEHILFINGTYYIPNSSQFDIKPDESKSTIIRQYVRNSDGLIIEEKVIQNGVHTETIRFYHIKGY